MIRILTFLIFFTFVAKAVAEEYEYEEILIETDFNFKYFSEKAKGLSLKPTYIGVGLGGHKSIHGAEALGIYLSGFTQIAQSDFAIFGRGELIRDRNTASQTRIWAWKASVGIGYYASNGFAPYLSLGQCYPSEASCFYIPTPDGSIERDTDSIYLGLGTFFKDPLFGKMFEVSIDWSPYSNHNNRSLYIGYALVFD